MEAVRQAYSDIATQYIDLFGSSTQAHVDDLELITRHLSIFPGVVLDAGCGPGHLTAHLRSREIDAVGIDLVPDFIDHARRTYLDGRYELGSIDQLPVADGSVGGVLAWYSLIHTPPDDLDAVLAELRRAIAPSGTLVTGFFDGDALAPFEHQVTTAYSWPADDFAARLAGAGFTEIERLQRPGRPEPGRRPHAAIAAIAD